MTSPVYWALVVLFVVVLRALYVAIRSESRRAARLSAISQARQARAAEDYYWDSYRLDALRVAMALTVDRYEPMLRELLSDNQRRSLEVVS